MNTTSLTRVVEYALPALSGSSVTYNADKGIFLTNGYTSAAGNTYFQGIRLSDRIVIKFDIGQGCPHTFLNGVQVYGFNGRNTKLIGKREFYCYFFNEYNAKMEAVEIIVEYMKSQSKLMGAHVDSYQVEQFAKQLVDDAYQHTKKIA